MKKSAKGQFALTIVSLILGLMLAAQFKNVQKVGGECINSKNSGS